MAAAANGEQHFPPPARGTAADDRAGAPALPAAAHPPKLWPCQQEMQASQDEEWCRPETCALAAGAGRQAPAHAPPHGTKPVRRHAARVLMGSHLRPKPNAL